MRRRRFNIFPVFLMIVGFSVIITGAKAFNEYRNLMSVLTVNNAEYIVISAINESIIEQSSQNVFTNLVLFEKDNEGKINAISTNMSAMNSLKANVTMAVYDKINQLEQISIEVPLGNLIGSDFFSTIGPKIKTSLLATGTPQCQFVSSFESSGVNQTIHRIMLNAKADICVVFPFGNHSFTIENDFIVMETILLGDVPESYTYVDDGNSTLIQKINDYNE